MPCPIAIFYEMNTIISFKTYGLYILKKKKYIYIYIYRDSKDCDLNFSPSRTLDDSPTRPKQCICLRMSLTRKLPMQALADRIHANEIKNAN